MKITLLDKKEIAKNTYSFTFRPEKSFSWLPGQYYYFTLAKTTPADPKGTTRHFTIASSPTEGTDIMMATRVRDNSAFKQTLKKLKIGKSIEGEGPEGTFIIDEKEESPHIMVAGGIGITPFRSVIKYHLDRKLESKLHLIYANSKPSEIAFADELRSWADNPLFSLTMTVSEPDKSWKGEKGRVDARLIQKIAKKYKNPTFWLCGPPSFIIAMEKVMGEMKIPSGNVRSEKFSGY